MQVQGDPINGTTRCQCLRPLITAGLGQFQTNMKNGLKKLHERITGIRGHFTQLT